MPKSASLSPAIAFRAVELHAIRVIRLIRGFAIPYQPVRRHHSRCWMEQQHRTIDCRSCGYAGRVLLAHHGYKWWMLPAAFAMACTGIGLIPLAIIFIVFGNRTYETCPNCGSPEHVTADGPLWPTSYDIWKKAQAADERAFKKNKWILFGVTMVILAAALTFAATQMRR